MAKRKSKRKPQIAPDRREPNGRLQRMTTVQQIEDAQRAQEETEMSVVLAQPHRLGSRSQARETALGRFVEDNRLRDELLQAGQTYAATKRKYRALIEAPRQERVGGAGTEPTPEVVARVRRNLEALEGAMLRAGVAALACVDWVAVDDKDLPPRREAETIGGLMALAVELEMIRPTDSITATTALTGGREPWLVRTRK